MKPYLRLSFEERVRIDTYRKEGYSFAEIGKRLKRNKSTIYRELRRFPFTYQPRKAEVQSRYFQRFRRKWQLKMDRNPVLRDEVLLLMRKRWSPVQISVFLKEKYSEDRAMQISHESIYTYIYVLPRGELKKELIALLRQKKQTRRRSKMHMRKTLKNPEMISIEERPKSVERRTVPGDWEGDLIIGKNHGSAIGTLVERKTRTVMLVPLGKKRGPKEVRRAFEKAVKTLPEQMRKSLTYDRGIEMQQHQLFTNNTKMKVYFCHPASPWERGTCENTNMLIRDFFPKGTDFGKVAKKELRKVQDLLNERPRKTLDWRTPKEVFNKELLALR